MIMDTLYEWLILIALIVFAVVCRSFVVDWFSKQGKWALWVFFWPLHSFAVAESAGDAA